MNTYEEILVQALSMPVIIASPNPKSNRMRYRNAMTHTRNKTLEYVFKIEKAITILYRQKEHRIIIGPKDFDAYLPIMLDIGTCSQEELIEAFKQTYKLPLMNLEALEKDIGEKVSEQKREEIRGELKIPESSSDILKKLGF